MVFALVDACGISLYLQGTLKCLDQIARIMRYIPVPTGNSIFIVFNKTIYAVYPCTYRELIKSLNINVSFCGISLYLQGTLEINCEDLNYRRYIPVPTGNSVECLLTGYSIPVYPCTYRELQLLLVLLFGSVGISLYLQGTRF